MLELPLHPILVHFPIALGMVAPVFISIVWLGIYRWNWPLKTWTLAIVLHAIIVVSSFTAVKTGDIDEKKVRHQVTEKAMEDHEELGETIPWVFVGMLMISSLPILIPGKRRMFSTLTLTLSFASIVPVIATGHSGGKLVYQYGAANAHFEKQQQSTTPTDQ